jgi:hypothetical protein
MDQGENLSLQLETYYFHSCLIDLTKEKNWRHLVSRNSIPVLYVRQVRTLKSIVWFPQYYRFVPY